MAMPMGPTIISAFLAPTITAFSPVAPLEAPALSMQVVAAIFVPTAVISASGMIFFDSFHHLLSQHSSLAVYYQDFFHISHPIQRRPSDLSLSPLSFSFRFRSSINALLSMRCASLTSSTPSISTTCAASTCRLYHPRLSRSNMAFLYMGALFLARIRYTLITKPGEKLLHFQRKSGHAPFFKCFTYIRYYFLAYDSHPPPGCIWRKIPCRKQPLRSLPPRSRKLRALQNTLSVPVQNTAI